VAVDKVKWENLYSEFQKNYDFRNAKPVPYTLYEKNMIFNAARQYSYSEKKPAKRKQLI
jgi:hypothetical protein